MNQKTVNVSEDFTQLISTLFDSASSKIQPINISSNSLAKDEMSSLIVKMESCKDWDERLSVIQYGISLIKGNSCDYSGFVSELPQLVGQILICIKDQSTTLVKYTCLFFIELFKRLQDQCESYVDRVIATFFETASSNKQIISSSCKFTILQIVTYVKTKSTLNEIIKQASSQSLMQKAIASECIKKIMFEWTRTNLLLYFKQLEKVIFDELSDSNPIIKENAKHSGMQMMKLFPNRSTILPPVLESLNNTGTQEKKRSSNKIPAISNNDFAHTISFSYNIPAKVEPLAQSTVDSNQKEAIEQRNQEKSFISNIPRKKKAIYNSDEYELRPENFVDEAQTIAFSYDPKSNQKPTGNKSLQKQVDESQTMTISYEPKQNSKQTHFSNNYKPDGEAQTMFFSFDANPKQKSSFYSEERSKNNANFSVHFHKPAQNDVNTIKNTKITSSNSNEIDNKSSREPKIDSSNAEAQIDDSNLVQNDSQMEEEPNNISAKNMDTPINSKQKAQSSESTIFKAILQKSPRADNFVCIENKENDFLDFIRTTIATKQTVYITQNAETIAEGIVHCIQSPGSSIEISGLNLFVDIVKIIPNSFENHLQKLVSLLIKKSDKSQSSTSMNATNALRTISSLYPSEALLLIGIQCTESNALLSFIANLVRIDESVLLNDEIASKLLPICCKIYETTTEQRISALAVGLLNKLHESNPKMFAIFAGSVDEQWSNLLKSLYLEPAILVTNDNIDANSIEKKQEPSRILTSMTKYTARNSGPEAKLENILSQLSSEKLKFSILNSLIDFFKETNGEVFQSSIPYLVKLINSSYYEQIKECISILANSNREMNNAVFLNSIIDYMVNDTSIKSIDCLSEVIPYYKSRDLSPRIQEILGKIKVFLEDENAIARKSAVFLIVQLRLSIGKVFDGEINKLSSIDQKLVQYYLSKKQNSSFSS